MIHYSVLVPAWDSTAALARLLRQTTAVLERLVLPYEILCIDDARRVAGWSRLMHRYRHLRVLRFSEARGTSASLAAGIAAARGDLIMAIATPRAALARRLPQLIARIGDYDLVVACQQPVTAAGYLRSQLVQTLRTAGGREPVAGESILWAARRQAVAGLALARGAWRVLPAIVERRGFQVGRLTFVAGSPPWCEPIERKLSDTLAARWHARRFEPHLAQELLPDFPAAIRPEWLRIAAARARFRAHVNMDVEDRASNRDYHEDILFGR